MQNGLKNIVILLLISSTFLSAENKFVSSSALVGMEMDYREYGRNDEILDSEKSNYVEMSGLDIGLGYLLLKEETYSKINFQFLYLRGESKYKGSYIGSSAGYGSVVSHTVNDLIDVELSYKKAHFMGDSLELNYGIGFGYRYWNRALSTTQSEVYKWFSLRPMIGLTYDISKNLFMKTSFEYQYGINPVTLAVEEEYEFKLGSANISQVAISLNYSVKSKFNIFLEYTAEVQEIEASNTVAGFYEPDSTAKNKYIKIGISSKY